MTLFFAIAALMLVATLAFVLGPLLRSNTSPSDPAAIARRRLQALNEAHATGVLSDKEFAAKLAQLGANARTTTDAQPPRSRGAFAAAVSAAFLIPVAAIVLYRMIGEPRALDPANLTAPAQAQATPEHGADMDQAITGLANKLRQNPDDPQGWALLGRAYLETQHFPEARDALKHAHDLVADDADVSVAYAEAMALAGESHRIEGESRTLLESALKADPANQRGIWLLGIAEYQSGKFNDAIALWNRLLAMLPKDSTVVQSVKNQIARAEADRDGRPPPQETASASAAETAAIASAAESEATTASAPSAPAAGSAPASPTAVPPAASTQGPALTVNVSLDPKLSGKVAPGDTLFVYAKAASGPPMPLAIRRMQAGQLPATVVLSDGMGMLPNMKLSQFPQVVIGARISKSGNAIAQSGDLQTLSKPLDVATTIPITLTIDQQVP